MNELNMAAIWDDIFGKENPYSEVPEPIDIVKDIVKFKKIGTVLDLGVGSGTNTLFLAEQGFNVVGVDISEVGIRLFRDSAKNIGIKVNGIVGDMAQFEFDRKYDVILSLGALNLITRDEADGLIQRIKVNTEDHGLNAIMVFRLLDPLEEAYFVFEQNELRNLYKDWKIISYKEYTTPIHEHENWPPHRHGNAVLLAQKT